MLLFAAGVSYHHLCDASILDCAPCQSEASHTGDEDGGCKSCEQSAKLSQSAQPAKVDVPLAYIYFVASVLDHLVFTSPQQIAVAVEPPPTELPLALILRDIKQSIPIRGPSITA